MSRVMPSIFKLMVHLSLVALATSGCALFEQKAGPKPITGPQDRVFVGSFDDIWRATQLALQSPTSYPLRVNNMDTGVIETETIKGSLVWVAPHKQEVPGGGLSYRIIVRVIKGNVADKEAFKVTVQKTAQMQRDFFSEAETVPSDGLEEKVILYRIERELKIDRALKRANKRSNQQG